MNKLKRLRKILMFLAQGFPLAVIEEHLDHNVKRREVIVEKCRKTKPQ